MIIQLQLHINGNCALLKVGIVDFDCLWNKKKKDIGQSKWKAKREIS